MAGPGNILIKVGAEAGGAIRELSKVDKALGETESSSSKMSAGLSKAAAPAALALGAIAVAGVAAAKAAAQDAAAQEHLAGVLGRVAGATADQVAQTEDWIAALGKTTGVADDELRPAMEKLATATGDVGESQKLMAQVLDISAASGKDVETVAIAVAKGYQGQTAAVAKLVPGLSEASRTSKDFGVIMGELADKTGGAMADSADTAAGQFKIFQLQMAELQETLGQALLPVLDALLPLLNKMAEFAAENTTLIKALVIAVAAVSAAILVANAAVKAYGAAQQIWMAIQKAATIAQWAWNVALEANPIGLVIIALVALGAAFVVLYKKSETFRDIVDGSLRAVLDAARALMRGFDALLDVAKAAFSWIVEHWRVAAFAFGPIGAAVVLIADNFDALKAAGKLALDAISGAIGAVKSAIDAVIGAVESLIGALGRIKVPHIDLPFGIGGHMAPALAVPGARMAGGPAGGVRTAAGGLTINVYGAVDPEGTARSIRRVLDDSTRRHGR